MERASRFSMKKEKKTRVSARLQVTYMQFILTKRASLSHCVEGRDRVGEIRTFPFKIFAGNNSEGGR